MLMRVAFVGTGTPADPVRANLPAYTTVGVDPIAGTMVVSIDAHDLPAGIDEDPDTKRVATVYGPAVAQLSPTMQKAWEAQLATRYPAAAHKYTPVLAAGPVING